MSACQSGGAALAADTRFCQSCGSPANLRADVSAPAAGNSVRVAVLPPSAETVSKTMDTNVVGRSPTLQGSSWGSFFWSSTRTGRTPLFDFTLSSPFSSMSRGLGFGSFG